ncbi:hypothetical protein EC988_004149 [Linderina pennispora]|nr:hypothetical protein EC988_004149 [Linderina pennispora]
MMHFSTIPELPVFWNQAVSGSLVQISQCQAPGWIEDTIFVLGACIRSLYLPDISTGNIVDSLLQCLDESSGDNAAALQLAFVAYEVLPGGNNAAEPLRRYISSRSPALVHEDILLVLEFADLSSKAGDSQLFVDWSRSRALTLIFDVIDARGLHEQALLRPPVGRAVRAYVQNRMRNDKLVAAVQACLDKGKQRLAQQLVCQYYNSRSADAIAIDAASAGIEPDIAKTEDLDVDSDENAILANQPDPDTSPAGEGIVPPETQMLAKRFSEPTKLSIYLATHK